MLQKMTPYWDPFTCIGGGGEGGIASCLLDKVYEKCEITVASETMLHCVRVFRKKRNQLQNYKEIINKKIQHSVTLIFTN